MQRTGGDKETEIERQKDRGTVRQRGGETRKQND